LVETVAVEDHEIAHAIGDRHGESGRARGLEFHGVPVIGAMPDAKATARFGRLEHQDERKCRSASLELIVGKPFVVEVHLAPMFSHPRSGGKHMNPRPAPPLPSRRDPAGDGANGSDKTLLKTRNVMANIAVRCCSVGEVLVFALFFEVGVPGASERVLEPVEV
jgi:hypothetical protein